MGHFDNILKGGDLRSIGHSKKVIALVDNQESFDELFQYLFHSDRKIVMRAADAIEKVTSSNFDYLKTHKKEILQFCYRAENKEFKWHLALLAPRLSLSKQEREKVWHTLNNWVTDKRESRIVRVNSLQGLFILSAQSIEFKKEFNLTLSEMEKENIPSLNARIRKLKNASR